MVKRKIKIAFVLGTRPEAIKLAPVIQLAKKDQNISPIVISTGQHKEMLSQALNLFKIKPKVDLKVMKKNQTLSGLTAEIIKRLTLTLNKIKPDLVLVQGDTTTAFAGALVAYYLGIALAHVEAGLRSHNKFQPFPEEINRRLVSIIADLHFAPTKQAKNNLRNEGIKNSDIFVVGNTIIDALKLAASKINRFTDKKLNNLNLSPLNILVTTHRRENLGSRMKEICEAINALGQEFPNFSFILPMHPNPKVRIVLKRYLGKNQRTHLIEPLDYPDFVLMMKKSNLILTDSGGVQEEAPSLGKPVLVMRETTERTEGINAGTAILVGTNKNKIVQNVKKLMNNKKLYSKMAKRKNPYGDGKSSQRILTIIKNWHKNINENK